MRGRVSSLNAAVAGSILLYEASSQRGGDRPVFQNPFAEPAGIDYEPVDEAAEPGVESVARAEPVTSPEPAVESVVPAPAPAGSESAAPKARPKARRKAAETAVEEPPETEEDALLPGASAIDSSDAASAE
jgi:hypothetical protein